MADEIMLVRSMKLPKPMPDKLTTMAEQEHRPVSAMMRTLGTTQEPAGAQRDKK